ncbi:flagellar basal-body rod protein FlgF [Gynuella sp.]|uniref:flagellar basal-body rod protein FlgF n=1 Tax=Gynuella sp. TaxID=2969146 RepID=UPI003D13DBB9
MLGSIYKGMVGMMAYSKGLSNISNNVANMNTPGYKRSELHFRELVDGRQLSGNSSQKGYHSGSTLGVDASLSSTVYSQGDIRKTENNTDMGIDGTGFFILRNGNHRYYTRVGQFEFDDQGYLVDKSFGYRVAGFEKGHLIDISLQKYRAIDPAATSFINLAGNLSVGSTTHTVNDVAVYDAEGVKHTLKIEFTNNGAVTARSWTVRITDDDDNVIASNLEFRFNENGSPAQDFNRHSFTLASDGGKETQISLNIGDPGSFNQITNFSSGSTSTVKTGKVDGYSFGVMTGFSVNDEGAIEVQYSNGESQPTISVALARFESPDHLVDEGGGLLSAQSFQDAVIGTSRTLGLGKIASQSIELSNVDLTSQFTDMIVLQRGYQASSQVLTSANEMLQQLIEATKGR